MMPRVSKVLTLGLASALLGTGSAVPSSAWAQSAQQEGSVPAAVEYLVPAMQGRSFAVEPGPRPYLDRLGFSPGFGQLGGETYYAMRMSYNPLRWLGWEAQLGHNPSQSVHALVHSLSAQVRWPLPWRVQPYGIVGFGMMMIFPGRVFEADPVTKNVVAGGAGLELYLRDDVALRGELRGTTVLGSRSVDENDGSTSYREFTFGLTFYRTIEP